VLRIEWINDRVSGPNRIAERGGDRGLDIEHSIANAQVTFLRGFARLLQEKRGLDSTTNLIGNTAI
jgi:hypothetical protein